VLQPLKKEEPMNKASKESTPKRISTAGRIPKPKNNPSAPKT